MASSPDRSSSPSSVTSETVEGKFKGIPLSDEAMIISGDQYSSKSPSSSSVNQDSKKTLEDDKELIERGSDAMEASNFDEAVKCFKRAIQLRIVRYGKLSPEYISAFVKYACALSSKALAETDHSLGAEPKEANSRQISEKDGCLERVKNDKCSAASVASGSGAKQDGDFSCNEGELGDGANDEDMVEDDDEGSKGTNLSKAAENISVLELASKVLEKARKMVSMYSTEAMQRVNIFSALQELTSETEDIKRFFSDSHNPLSILKRPAEPYNLQMAELYFRICYVLEAGSKPEKAIPYCKKALSLVSIALLHCPVDEFRGDSATSDPFFLDKKAQIGTLTRLLNRLEEKLLQLEELNQLALRSTPLSSEVLQMASANSRDILEKMFPTVSNSSQSNSIDCPTDSIADTNASGSDLVRLK